MNKIKVIIVCTLISIFSLSSSGCWNYREINFLTLVAGMAVDKLPDGRFLVTFESVEPSGGKEAKSTPKIIQSEGVTLFDAIRNAVKVSGKKLYFSHTKVVIVSQDIAKSGISPVLDWITRDAEPRLELYLMVSKGRTANEILDSKEVSGKSIRSYEIYNILKTQSSVAKSTNIPVYRLNNTLASEGISATIPVVDEAIRGSNKVLEVSGTAILKKDKLIGFLNEEDTKYLLFVRNRIKTPLLIEIINLDSSNTNKTPNVSLEVFKNTTKTTPQYSNGKLAININIKTEAAISEIYSGDNFVNDKNRAVLIDQSQKHLETDINKLIKKVQNDYGVDIFGFGTLVKANIPSLWKTMDGEWNKIFTSLEVNVTSEIKIRNEGIQGKPIKIGG